jgi:hypothetical protein
MKKILLRYLFITIIFSVQAPKIRAQHTEYSISGGIGLFHYITKEKQEPFYSMINMTHAPNYANVPYGNKNGLSYQFSVELKKITRHPFLWGIGLEYEDVKSRKDINWVYGPYNELHAAKGNVSLSNYFLALQPYIGYRFKCSKFYLDAIAGIDLAITVSAAYQHGVAIVDSTQQQIHFDIKSHSYEGWDPFQTRARFQTEFGYKKWGLYLGYSWGFYKGKLVTFGGKPLYSFSRYFRAGIFYRLK